jgi:hypothetical protein
VSLTEASLFIFNIKELIKKIIFNISIVVFIVFILDLVIGKTLRYYYFKETSGLHFRTTFSIDSTTAQVLIFGASRSSHHYVTELFKQKLSMGCYNCGRDGNSILYSYAIFKAATKRYNPIILIFDVNPNELNYELRSYDRLSSLLPYYKTHPEIRSIIKFKSSFEKYKMLSNIYPYNSSLLAIAIGNLELNKKRKDDSSGYIPLYNIIEDTILHNLNPVENYLDTNKVNAVTDIIQYCSKNNIRLVFVQSPLYAKVSNTLSTEYFKKLAKESNVIFWNFSNEPEFVKKPDFFQDMYHMNDKGAIYFSDILIQKIKLLQSCNP